MDGLTEPSSFYPLGWRQVMRQYQLGPNGAIMTSLNLFATRFDQVGELSNG
jgi:hypothetical protein